MSLKRDPIVNGIYREMKEPIVLLFEKEFYRGGLILLLSSIEALAHIARPNDQKLRDVNLKEAFTSWIKKYLLLDGGDKISEEDWWSLRNGVIHTHSPYSFATEEKNAKYILFKYKKAPVLTNGFVPDAVMISIESFSEGFFNGIDLFLVDVFKSADAVRMKILEDRINMMLVNIPMPN